MIAAKTTIAPRSPSASASAGLAAIPTAMPMNIPIVPSPVAMAPCSGLNRSETSLEMPLTTTGWATAMPTWPASSAQKLASWIRRQEKAAITTAPAPTTRRYPLRSISAPAGSDSST